MFPRQRRWRARVGSNWGACACAPAAGRPPVGALLVAVSRTRGGPGPSSAMAPLTVRQSRLWPPTLLLLLLSLALQGARPEPAGSAVPAQSRPCVDCHAFEFMQRALQDLRKTAYSLDARISQVQGCSRGSIPYRKEFLDIRGRKNRTVLQLETPRPSCCRPNDGPSVLAGQLDAEDP